MNHIILIGFMGAGKTTIGKVLARENRLGFLDTDEQIEKEQQMKITDIFTQYGETYFRNLETKLLKDLQNETRRMVISVGGGLPVRKENRVLLKTLGCVVYLQAEVETLAARLTGSKNRPKLAGGDLRGRIISLMEAREALYLEAADVQIRTDDKKIQEVVKEIGKHVL